MSKKQSVNILSMKRNITACSITKQLKAYFKRDMWQSPAKFNRHNNNEYNVEVVPECADDFVRPYHVFDQLIRLINTDREADICIETSLSSEIGLRLIIIITWLDISKFIYIKN